MTARAAKRSEFSQEQAAALAADLYGIEAAAIELPSERDQNFHLRNEKGDEFVLKIGNSGEDTDILEFQNAAMEHVAERLREVYVPRVLPSRSGQKITPIQGAGAARYFIRLVTYLPA